MNRIPMIRDKLGNELMVGQTVLKVRENGVNAVIDFRKVLKISDGRVYLNGLDGSDREVAVRFPSRLIVWPEGAALES
jgi:hypothetical protein